MYIVTNEWKKEPTEILQVTVRWTDVCVGFYDSQESIETKGFFRYISMGDGGGHAVPKPPTGIQKQLHLQPIPLIPLLQDSKPLKPLSHHPANYCSNSNSQTTPYQHPNAHSK